MLGRACGFTPVAVIETHRIFRGVLDPAELLSILPGCLAAHKPRNELSQSGVELNRVSGLGGALDPLGELATALLPGCELRLNRSSFRVQPPNGEGGLKWHQDFHAIGGNGLAFWVPLSRIDGSMPTLEIGVDKCPLYMHQTDEANYLVMVNQDEYTGRTLVIDGMNPGDVLLLYPETVHRTVIPDGCKKTRYSLDVRFRAVSN